MDTRHVEDWYSSIEKLRSQREVTIWALTKDSLRLLDGVWLPIIVYSPYTPAGLRKKLEKVLGVDRVLLLSRTYVNSVGMELVLQVLNKNFGVVVFSDTSPNPVRRRENVEKKD